MIEETRWVRSRVHIPIIADEACLRPEDVPKIAGAFDGINIKLMKCGGIKEGLTMIGLAKSLGMKVMLGCMIESSLGITAAAHLASEADYLDLDSHLLIENDPYLGVKLENGKLVLNDKPGLGVEKRTQA
jgi:L-alanine-DL-glutamate epimerase-like enolase superfamily enzyme